MLQGGTRAATKPGSRISVVGNLPANVSEYHTSFVKELAAFVGNQVAQEAVTRYSVERFGDATQAAGKLLADLVIMCPTWKLASALALYDSPVWAHDFNGVHGADVSLFFNTAHFFCPTCLQLNSQKSTQIANSMERWWLGLLKDARPTSNHEWPRWSRQNQSKMFTDPFNHSHTFNVLPADPHGDCAFLNEHLPQCPNC